MPTSEPIITSAADYDALVDAAVALLEARENQMITGAEWEALQSAVQKIRPMATETPDPDDIN